MSKAYKVKSSGRTYEVYRGDFQDSWVYEFAGDDI